MAVNLFIDTNIFLSFYHFSGEDLEELNKLAVLLDKRHIHLLLPEQVCDEFSRNRENKINSALKGLREQRLNLQFPQLCKDYGAYDELRRLQKLYQHSHSELLDKLSADVEAANLKADQLIRQLFKKATRLPSPSVLEAARRRRDIGNPPGKDGSLGDAINWETVLAHAPNLEVLHFVTDDSDYYSPLYEEAFMPFLRAEFMDCKAAELKAYKRLSQFFAVEFPQIHLASEIEKDLLIDQLAKSPHFHVTHRLVAELSQFAEFTVAQANAILSAAASNSQVGWIAGDADVRDLLRRVMGARRSELDQSLVEAAETAIARLSD